MLRILSLSLALVISAAAGAATAYPERPIRLVVPFPAGGATDIMARIMAARLSEDLGRTVVVDNRGAASGIVGTETVANAVPDGYTVLHGSSSTLAINAVTYSKLPYDPVTSFAPVAMFGELPMLVLTKTSTPAQSLRELIALARSKPDSLMYAASSSAAELATEWLSVASGIRMVPVPYRGTGDAMRDFLAGQFDVMINPMATAYPLAKSGKARALAITTRNRSPLAPEIPTVAEQGIAGFDVSVWHCLMVPRGTPQAIVERLSRATAKTLAASDVKDGFARLGAQVRRSSPGELADHIKREIANWQNVAKTAGIKPKS
jgi:tripartite-type tricarboxylate transporter receptor subunit TctC